VTIVHCAHDTETRDGALSDANVPKDTEKHGQSPDSEKPSVRKVTVALEDSSTKLPPYTVPSHCTSV
jgi:hypothetical protein